MKFQYGPVTILGELASKSNSRRLVRWGNRIGNIKSAKAMGFLGQFMMQIKRPTPLYAGDVELHALVYYKSRRPDLDVALLMDAIQQAGILKNDRAIRAIHAVGKVDKENPRVVFRLEAVSEAAV